MDENLRKLIESFNESQKKAIDVMVNEFGYQRPENIDDFLRYFSKSGKYLYECNGYKILPHGFGMWVDLKDVIIDFDLGRNGEINGFDPWRLYRYQQENHLEMWFQSVRAVEKVVEDSVKSGEIFKSEHFNYYLSP